MLQHKSNMSKKGSALVVGMIAVMLISGLVIVYHMLMLSQTENARSFEEHQAANYLAKAGVGSVYAYVKAKNGSVTEGLAVANSGKIPLIEGQSVSYTGTSNENTYYVTVTRKSATSANLVAPYAEADMVAIYEIVSSGVANDSVETFTSVIDVTITTSFSLNLDKAIITEGDIDLQGDPQVLGGVLANVHTNGNGFIQNGVVVEGQMDASGELDIQGTVTINGEIVDDPITYETEHSGVDRIDLPTIRAEDYEDLADYKLLSSGEIYVKATETTVSAASLGWKHTNGGGWSLKNNTTPPEAFYYVEGDILMNEDLGTDDDPFNITVATTGNFSMNGGSRIAPYKNDLAVLANLDIGVNGHADASYSGIFLAHEQIDFSGSSTTVGMLISTGVESTSNVALQTNRLTGTTDFTAGSDLSMPNTDDDPTVNENIKQMRKSSSVEQSDNFARFGLGPMGQEEN